MKTQKTAPPASMLLARVRPAAAWVAVVLAASLSAGAGPKEPPDAVTTTVQADPFPNLPPKALDRWAVVEAGTHARTPSVLLGVYDVEGDTVSVASFTQPAHGSAERNADGTFTYRPRAGYVGGDEFDFTLTDGRGGQATARMHVRVIRPSGKWSTTSFVNFADVQAGGEDIQFGKSAVAVRAWDGDGDGLTDLLVGAEGGLWWYRNVGAARSPKFAGAVAVQAGGREVRFGKGRLSVAVADMDRDGRPDVLVVTDRDRKVRLLRNLSPKPGRPSLAEAVVLQAADGSDFVAPDVRVDVADWNGDGLPDVLTGTFSGAIKVSYNVGSAAAARFSPPVEDLDADGRTISGSYNLNVRVADLNQDGVADLVDSYNWGTIHFRINAGDARRPRLPTTGTFGVRGPGHAKLNLHALCNGPIVDFADFDGDGTIDLVAGGEGGGKVRMGMGQGGRSYLAEIRATIDARKADLAGFLADPNNEAGRNRLAALEGALYDYVTAFATPPQKAEIARGLIQLIEAHPRYFAHQPFDPKTQPHLAGLAVQTWLTLLMTSPNDPAARKRLADAAKMTGGYRKLVEDIGLIYADNARNPRGAEAIWQWLRTIPRELYPGTCITANDWLGGRAMLVRGHMKNTFNGYPVDNGEYGFGRDARAVIGERGSENWFMTVVRHEACHDLDAYVRRSAELTRRWGQTLLLAGGPDMRGDPKTGWLSWDRTKEHFRQRGLWDGQAGTWKAAWEKYWQAEPGKGWRDFGFMRGNIPWFYGAPQESLATQGNQFWNSTEGRIQVAIDRWSRGYRSNLTEVLLFLDIWSVGLEKVKFYEVDNACRQVISFARLRRTPQGYIDRIDLGDRYYEFKVDAQGVTTDIVHPGVVVHRLTAHTYREQTWGS
ncbi:MAG TPA: FG-GAP-like repeat-containing protein [Phycisphaerae bacterium]|nr:FG-GAP-like repeat-containing protein [Phycisphaerae bacterium]